MKKLMFLTFLMVSVHMGSFLCMNRNSDDYQNDIFNLSEVLNGSDTDLNCAKIDEERDEINLSLMNFNNNDNNFDTNDFDHYAAVCDVMPTRLPCLGKRLYSQNFENQPNNFEHIALAPIRCEEIINGNTGIINENGTDCFIASSLQVLKNIPEFLALLITETGFSQKLNSFIEKLHSNTEPMAGISLLRSSLIDMAQNDSHLKLMKYGQHDAQEFILGLLAELNNEVIRYIFGVNIQSNFFCTTCLHGWNSLETNELFLPINLTSCDAANSVSIRDLIEGFEQENFIEDGLCETCKSKGIIQSMAYRSLPKVLMISFKRFICTENGATERLDVSVDLQENLCINGQNYKIFGVILHHADQEASLNSGHYTVLVQNADSKWYHYDDTVCHEVSIEKVIEPSRKPYVCFYRRDS